MTEKWVIQESRARTVGNTPCWEVLVSKSDGTLHAHLIPIVALEWRAAEYGIDPTDIDTLLTVILHEPHMPLTDDGSGPRYADTGPDLWTADNTDAARDAHLKRVKTCPVRIDVQGVKAIDVIRSSHRPDPDRIRQMRETVDTTRWVKQHGGLPKPPLPQSPAAQKEAARA